MAPSRCTCRQESNLCEVCERELRARLAEVERERDLAVAHDTQPYPTAWAYEQACRVRDSALARVAVLEAAAQRLIDAMRWEEELRSHVLTHDGDCLVHALRAALAPTAGDGNLRPPTEVGK
jgi:hypothetical protein